jgi:hypothetical protein
MKQLIKILTLSMSAIFAACGDDNNDDTVTINGFKNEVSITEKDGYRYILSNGIPNHEVGQFPNSEDPIAIAAVDLEYRMPLQPSDLPAPLITTGYELGVAINGVPYDPNGPFYIHNNERLAIMNPFQGIASGWQYEGLAENVKLCHDDNNAHVQPPGLYHYHGVPTGLINKLTATQKTSTMLLLGYAADGYPIYNNMSYSNADNTSSTVKKLQSSYRLKTGARPANPSDKPTGPSGNYDGTFVQDYEYIRGLGDLDECNGRYGKTPEYPNGTYYYVITDNWPFIPRYFRGAPDVSFKILG